MYYGQERCAIPGGPSDSTGAREPEINLQIMRLANEIERAEMAAADLIGRIEPVLQPTPPPTGKDQVRAADGPASALANQLRALTERVSRIADATNATRNRVEV